MSDNVKYAKFFMGTMFKLAFFLVACTGVKLLCLKFFGSDMKYVLPSVAAVFISWLLLAAVEENTRSFFATGYMVSNIVPGMLWGVAVAAAGPFAGLLLGVNVLKLLPEGFDLRIPFYEGISSGLFYAIVIFGYFFHILQHDFGAIPAVLISSVIYGFLAAIDHTRANLLLISDNINKDFLICAAGFAVVGVAAGMLILALGDMRSAAAFLFVKGVCDCFSANLFASKGGTFISDFAGPVMAIFCAVSMFVILKKDQ